MREMGERQRENMDRFQREQENWRSSCAKCGEAFIGTMKALSASMTQHMKEKHDDEDRQ